MALKVIISSPNKEWTDQVKNYLETNNYETLIPFDGKETQLLAYKNKVYCCLLDLETKNNSAFEVLKYLKTNYPSLKIILIASSKSILENMELSKDELINCGASDVLCLPTPLERITQSMDGEGIFEVWKHVVKKEGVSQSEMIDAYDHEFTRIDIKSFYSGSINLFDHYIRLSANKYIKILHKGELFEKDRVKDYLKKGVKYLFFKTKDRSFYINYMNVVLEKMVDSNKVSTMKKFNTFKNVAEKYIDEIYTVGLKPQLIEEGTKICNNVFQFVQKDKGLSELMRNFEQIDPQAYSHNFLVTFFSVVICKHLKWASNSTIQLISQGAMFHDIGKIQFPESLRGMYPDEMSEKQLEKYYEHPNIGIEMLSKFSSIKEPVKQIIYQHHELINGLGFPNGLTGMKIYPPAKVVCLVDDFVNGITRNRLTPLQGLQKLIPDKRRTSNFEPSIIKALVMGFTKRE